MGSVIVDSMHGGHGDVAIEIQESSSLSIAQQIANKIHQSTNLLGERLQELESQRHLR